jgi:hypothetical protein
MKFKLRDILAVPFCVIGLLLIHLGILIGGAWTASQFDKLFNYKQDL